jgi:hypothetical protein
METIKIKYLGGNRAREVNPLGERPSYDVSKQDGNSYRFIEWKQAEKNLREFEIEEVTVYNKKELDIEKDVIIKYDGEDIFKLGSTHNAIILENGKVRKEL